MRLFTCSILLAASLLSAASDEPLFRLKGAMRVGPVPGKPREEYLVSVTAKPAVEHKEYTINGRTEHFDILTLPAVNGREISIICDPNPNSYSPWYATMPTDKVLTFTVWQTKMVRWHDDEGNEDFRWESSIETIKDGSTVLYDARVCPLHKTVMKRLALKIAFGLPALDFIQELGEASKEFPEGRPFVFGGCVHMEGEEDTRMGYLCDQCSAAYQRWEKAFEAKHRPTTAPAQPPATLRR